eukprot:15454207-Alexandrium_andersonii.AAC.1
MGCQQNAGFSENRGHFVITEAHRCRPVGAPKSWGELQRVPENSRESERGSGDVQELGNASGEVGEGSGEFRSQE